MLDFQTTVRSRQSVRAFLPQTIADSDLQDILTDAQAAPSACNTQPWEVHIVSGETLAKLSEVMKAAFERSEFTPETPFDQTLFGGKYESRWRAQYKHIYDSFGVAREDKEGRAEITRRNFEFYGAPHAASAVSRCSRLACLPNKSKKFSAWAMKCSYCTAFLSAILIGMLSRTKPIWGVWRLAKA